jgi:transcriptional regulator with XRE-family HTH domain
MGEPQAFPAYLRGQLDARSWSQADLQRNTGIAQSLISRWLSGAVAPGLDSIRVLADAFGRPLLEVLVDCGLITKGEARQRTVMDLSALTNDQLIGELKSRLSTVDVSQRLTRVEVEGPDSHMTTGRPKRGAAAKK